MGESILAAIALYIVLSQKSFQMTAIPKCVPGEDISTEDTANNIAQVGDVVDVRQSTGQKDVPLALLR